MSFLRICTIFSLMSLCSIAWASISSPSPIGLWQTIDDVSGEPKAIVQISESGNKTLMGKILKVYPKPEDGQNLNCSACEGENHNKPIVGMVILKDLKPADKSVTKWIDREILDPKTGKIYHSSIQIVENGQKLSVRGYIGLPLFGRSQTWLRVNSIPESKSKK